MPGLMDAIKAVAARADDAAQNIANKARSQGIDIQRKRSDGGDAQERTTGFGGHSRVGGHTGGIRRDEETGEDTDINQSYKNKAAVAERNERLGILQPGEAERIKEHPEMETPALFSSVGNPGNLSYTYDRAGNPNLPNRHMESNPMNSTGAYLRGGNNLRGTAPISSISDSWNELNSLGEDVVDEAKEKLNWSDYETSDDMIWDKTNSYIEDSGYDGGYYDFFEVDTSSPEDMQRFIDFMNSDPQLAAYYNGMIIADGYQGGLDDAEAWLIEKCSKSAQEIIEGSYGDVMDYFYSTNPDALQATAEGLAHEGILPNYRGPEKDKDDMISMFGAEEGGEERMTDAYEQLLTGAALAANYGYAEEQNMSPEEAQRFYREQGIDPELMDWWLAGSDVTPEYVEDVTGDYEEHTVGADPEPYTPSSFEYASMDDPFMLDAGFIMGSIEKGWVDPMSDDPYAGIVYMPDRRAYANLGGYSADITSKKQAYEDYLAANQQQQQQQ